MGSAELINQQLTIFSHIITYGNAADTSVTENMREEIETMWNEAQGSLKLNGLMFNVVFRITASFQPGINDIDICKNWIPAIIISASKNLPMAIFLLLMG
jgi:hypothetical protein